MKICELCKKDETEWKKSGTYPFMFVYTVKTDDKEHIICPECTGKRLEEDLKNLQIKSESEVENGNN